MKNKNKHLVSKEISKTTAYFLFDAFENIWNYTSKKDLSSSTIKKYNEFINCLYEDIEHLKCDELCDTKLTEYGYIYD